MKILPIIFLLVVRLASAQTSQHGLTAELLADLRLAVADTLGTNPNSVVIDFPGDTPTAAYLTQIVGEKRSGMLTPQIADTVGCTITQFTLQLDADSLKPAGNSIYIRKLKLQVSFGTAGYVWQGQISDRVPIQAVNQMLEESYPVPISGNFRASEPRIPVILLTTLGVLTVVTALFFIRT